MTRLSRPAFYLFIALGLAFWALYLAIGCHFVTQDLIQNDRFFHSDLARVVLDMCRPYALHPRTNVHPIFVLLTMPVGSRLTELVGSPEFAAALLTSFVGGVCVTTSGFFFLAAGVPLRRALLCSLLLACSAAHLFFGSLPDSFILSALSIILLFWAVASGRRDWKVFLPAGIFSFGILITNLAFAAIAYGSTLFPTPSVLTALRRWMLYLAALIIATMLLAGLQKLFWKHTTLFFVPQTYTGESRFFRTPNNFEKFVSREDRLVRHVFGLDWFGSALRIFRMPNGTQAISIEKDLKRAWRGPSKAGMTLWIGLLLVGSGCFFAYRLYAKPLPAALALAVLSQLTLHSVYGDDLFLYGCNTCFPIIAWLGVSLVPLPSSRRVALAIDAALLVTLALEIANNRQFLAQLLAFQRW